MQRSRRRIVAGQLFKPNIVHVLVEISDNDDVWTYCCQYLDGDRDRLQAGCECNVSCHPGVICVSVNVSPSCLAPGTAARKIVRV